MKIISVLILLNLFFWACTSTSEKKQTVAGIDIYKSRCVTCHGTDGKMGMNGAKDLPASPLNLEQRIAVITHGRSIMPGFKEIMSAEDIKAVAEFTMTLK